METKNKQPYLIFIAIIISGILVSIAIAYKSGFKTENQPASPEKKSTETSDNDKKNPPKNKENINIDGEGDDPALGNPDAPITITIFGDFQCHYCRKLELEVKPLIVEKYVKTGKAKIIARDFPFLGKDSILAAEAGNCAFEKDKYFEFSDMIHKAQKDEEITVNENSLKMLAKKLDLNSNEFSECLDSHKYLDEVKKDFDDGRALGIEGTPTTYINKEVLNGALPFEEFEKVIESFLN